MCKSYTCKPYLYSMKFTSNIIPSWGKSFGKFLDSRLRKIFYVACILISTCQYFMEPFKLKVNDDFKISQDIIDLQGFLYIKRRSYQGYFMKKIKSTIINWLTILHLGLNINFVYYSKFVIQFYINKE